MLHRVILGIAFAALLCSGLMLSGVVVLESEWTEPRYRTSLRDGA